ncbi:MAG TPA: hypothetical protein VE200_01425, partial [Xanthobacteraceae bacterium]|nr:hypothetical protein [Xanthobacteraceae bacterium]
IARRLEHLQRIWASRETEPKLIATAMVEREIDRARRSFGMFFEIFSQRGSPFARPLAAHDMIATDCYRAVRAAAPDVFSGALLKPVTYMEHGYSPATQRRGVQLARLLGDKNPFPVIRIPWDRDNPWQAVFLHEVAHNIQADLGLWHENQTAVAGRMMGSLRDPLLVSIFRRWHKEIFADLAAILLGGPASAAGMMNFLSHPSPRSLTYRPGGAHPTGYVRGFILADMLDRLGFGEDANNARRIWRDLYNPRRGHRLPLPLLRLFGRAIPEVVDEIAFQPRRSLGQRALADVIPFRREDQVAIRRGAMQLAAGRLPAELPPRFLVSASAIALASGAPATELSNRVVTHLSNLAAAERNQSRTWLAAVA